MESKEYAKECGLRLRRVRMAKNMSQQDLADKMFTTPQNVSKWEKEGVRDIDTIKNLSQILGQDLLSDERNEEGIVGEIGKHILKKIAENGGFLPVTELIEDHMFGLKSETVTEEIFKLQKIGMCVREQYKNFYDEAKDMLFITAKGVITLNNFLVFGSVQCKTYEQFLENRLTIQQYYDENKVERLVRNLHYYGTYRIDYINHLHKRYEDIYIDETEDNGVNYGSWTASMPLLPGESFNVDLLFRMICGLDDKKLNELVSGILMDDTDYWEKHDLNEHYEEYLTEYYRLKHKYEKPEIPYTDAKLGELSPLIQSWNEDVDKTSSLKKEEKLNKSLDLDKEHYVSQLQEETDEIKFLHEKDVDYFVKQANAFVEDKYPSEWFSLEEIKAFIKENFKSATTPEEKKTDEILAEINKLEPCSLNYYSCSREWEKAGIEKMIKSFYNLNADDESEADDK